MNMFKAFEARVAKAFGASSASVAMPFSFRKLARRAAHEMEQETLTGDGAPTAPALYTILVSSADDAMMRPLYAELTNEISQLVEGAAARKGYVFVGKPLARFMVDGSLRHGRFAVFANNVDALTLEKLREEERAFLAGFDAFGTGVPDAAPGIVIPFEQNAAAAPDVDDSAVGLEVMPEDYVEDAVSQVSAPNPAAREARALADALPEVLDEKANPIVTPMPEVVASAAAVPEVAGAPAPTAVPASPYDRTKADPNTEAAPAPVVQPDPVTCLLIDRQSGRTYLGTAPRTAIGRERVPGGIVLHDPNVSRHHAELVYDGSTWRVRDLGSTNGTLVNDVDIDSCVLRDGDLITLGLLNLEFRES